METNSHIAARVDGFFMAVMKYFKHIAAILLVLMPIPVFLDVVIRLVVDYSLPGIIELEEFLLLIIIFFSLPYVHGRSGHIRIDLITSKMPGRLQNVLACVMSLLAISLFVLLTWQLVHLGISKMQSNEVSWTLKLPMWIFYFLAASGSALMVYMTLRDFLVTLKKTINDKGVHWLILGIIISAAVFFAPFMELSSIGMSPSVMGIAVMILLFILIFLGMPIGFAMCLTGFLGMVLVYHDPLPALRNLGLNAYAQSANYFYTVGPLFILMGQLAFYSGISHDLFETASKWLGRMRGGIAISSVSGCAGFSAVCGDSLATAVTMGTLAIPEMKKKEYSMRLATACLAAGGTLGILIPPSVGFIFYAIVTEVSIGQLFIAGLIPGLIMTALFIAAIWIIAKINPDIAPPGTSSSLKEKISSLKGIVGMLALFVLILGGILGGFFSPVEGGSIGCVGAFTLSLIRRRLKWKTFIQSLDETLDITAKLLMILIGVGILGYFLAATRLPMAMAEFVTNLDINRYVILIIILLFFILMGCLLNVIPMILLVLPTIFPMIIALGFDPVWFGVICVITMEMGQITPPIGVSVFAIGSVAPDVPMEEIFKGIVPFFLCMVICVVFLILFPRLATFLPEILF